MLPLRFSAVHTGKPLLKDMAYTNS